MGPSRSDGHATAVLVTLSPLITPASTNAAALRLRGLARCGLVGQQLEVRHLPSPRPAKQRDQETLLNRVLAASFLATRLACSPGSRRATASSGGPS